MNAKTLFVLPSLSRTCAGMLFVAWSCTSLVLAQQPSPIPSPVAIPAATPSLVPRLIEQLRHGNEQKKIEAGMALREVVKASDGSLLIQALKEGNSTETQISIIEALTAIPEYGLRKILEAYEFEFDHGSLETRRAVLQADGRLRDDLAIPFLTRVLRDNPELELRKAAASALGRIGSEGAVYALETSYSQNRSDSAPAISWAIKKARGQINEKEADIDLPNGRKVQLNFYGLSYLFYQPALRLQGMPKPRLLVAIHDSNLLNEPIFEAFLRVAKENRLALLVPLFDDYRFPAYGTFNVRGERSDTALLNLIKHIGDHADVEVREFSLVGVGSGGAMAQRLAMVYPRRISRATFFANDFTVPDPLRVFPEGIAPNPRCPDIKIDPYEFAKADIGLITSSTREERRYADRFFSAYQAYAEQNGILLRMIELEGGMANLAEVADSAGKFLFPKAKN